MKILIGFTVSYFDLGNPDEIIILIKSSCAYVCVYVCDRTRVIFLQIAHFRHAARIVYIFIAYRQRQQSDRVCYRPSFEISSASTGIQRAFYTEQSNGGITLRRGYVDENCARQTICDKRNQSNQEITFALRRMHFSRASRHSRVHSASSVHTNRRILILRGTRVTVCYSRKERKKTRKKEERNMHHGLLQWRVFALETSSIQSDSSAHFCEKNNSAILSRTTYFQKKPPRRRNLRREVYCDKIVSSRTKWTRNWREGGWYKVD